MLNIFKNEKNRTKFLILIFVMIFLGILSLFIIEFFVKKNILTYEEELTYEKKDINIDFEILERVKRMRSFEKIEPFSAVRETPGSGSVIGGGSTIGDGSTIRRGRENPFIFYTTESEPESNQEF